MPFDGPIPKRSEERRRNNEPEVPIVKVRGAETVEKPPAEEGWHPIARGWYDSLDESGQVVFYEPSDWHTARIIAESISRELKPQLLGFKQTGDGTTEPIWGPAPVKGASLAGWLKGMTALLVTEGDRRRMRVELQRPQLDLGDDLPEGVTAISSARDSILG